MKRCRKQRGKKKQRKIHCKETPDIWYYSTASSKSQHNKTNKTQKLQYLLILAQLLVPDPDALCLGFELECIFCQFLVPLLHQALHVHGTVNGKRKREREKIRDLSKGVGKRFVTPQ